MKVNKNAIVIVLAGFSNELYHAACINLGPVWKMHTWELGFIFRQDSTTLLASYSKLAATTTY